MLYKILHVGARIALHIWCRQLTMNKPAIVNHKGPLLIAANHPNSFLDAILLCSIFKQPIYSLARGDVFKNNTVSKILRALKMFPVYRVSEGVENLNENYKTFDECLNIFKQNGIVLIFSEGKCVNEWHLRPLKKGTARLALAAWQQHIDLQIIPIGINYQSFTSFGKNIQLQVGEMISPHHFEKTITESDGVFIKHFNELLKLQLQKLVVEIKPANVVEIKKIFEVKVSRLKKIIFFLPSLFGYLAHAPLYIPMQKWSYKKFSTIDHYNSVLIGILFLSYPLYLMLLALVIYFIFGGWYWIAVFIVMPMLAYCFVQIKKQF